MDEFLTIKTYKIHLDIRLNLFHADIFSGIFSLKTFDWTTFGYTNEGKMMSSVFFCVSKSDKQF